jgi:hypothetical protein
MSEQVSTPTPGTTSRTRQRLLILFSGLVVLAIIVTAGLMLTGRENPVPASLPAPVAASPSQASPAGSPSPAICPPQWELVDKPPVASRDGNLVPGGATKALLCSYRPNGPHPLPLGATHTLTTNVDTLIGYLNGLPSAPPKNEGCMLGGTTEHVIVFEYPDRQPAVVYDRNCGWDQGGAIRYDGDIKKITGYWGVPWNE